MIICKHCCSEKNVKDGNVREKLRYKCKDCGRTFRKGDLREKYTIEKKVKVVKWYLEGVGIRSIERMEKVSSPLIIQWIRNFSKIMKEKINSVKIPENAKKIEILELDELFSYCQKNLTKSTFGLLLIESEIRLLTSK